jgi:hypothetical protein
MAELCRPFLWTANPGAAMAGQLSVPPRDYETPKRKSLETDVAIGNVQVRITIANAEPRPSETLYWSQFSIALTSTRPDPNTWPKAQILFWSQMLRARTGSSSLAGGQIQGVGCSGRWIVQYCSSCRPPCTLAAPLGSCWCCCLHLLR